MCPLPKNGRFEALSIESRCRFQSFFMRFFCTFSVICLGLALTTVTGCSSSDTVGVDQPAVKAVYFTSGDPDELIKGAEFKRQSPIKVKELETFNAFAMMSSYSFIQKVPVQKLEAPEVSEKPREAKMKSVGMHRFTQLSKGRYLYGNGDVTSDLEFREANGVLIWDRAFGHKVEALHYSVSETINAFSLLGSYQDPTQGQVLLTLIFFKPETSPSISRTILEKSEELYSYLFGPNVLARWNKPKTISICGKFSDTFDRQVVVARDQWQEALGERLDLKLEMLKDFPPFSDLNTSCIYSVDQYILDSREDFYLLGRTFFAAYLPEAELIDSDIFMFEAEFQKMKPKNTADEIENARQRTLTHEVGHLLGLHHVFDGRPSIMSYNRDDKKVTSYDKSAIQALYDRE